MFKIKRGFRVGLGEILIFLLVGVVIWLFIRWRNKKDKENIKGQIMASAPAKICVNCDTENAADAKFCKSCGSNQFSKHE